MLTHNPHKHLKKILARLYDDNNPVRKKGSLNDELGIMENPQSPNYYRQRKRAKDINDLRDTINPESGIGNVPDEYLNKENVNTNLLDLLTMFNTPQTPPPPMGRKDNIFPIPNFNMEDSLRMESVPEEQGYGNDRWNPEDKELEGYNINLKLNNKKKNKLKI